MGVDAFIVQDLGLISLINKLYPLAQIHLSTQMGIHNLEGILALKKYNFTRVVLARETPLEEIIRIKKNCDVEIEYFVQGALCVSFSGNCYLSSYTQNASGNRGKCKQLCRLPYTLIKNGKKLKRGYFLSAKDFNMIDRLSDLKNAGVDSIKIEGRARRPYYVAVATRQYYNALNNLPTDLSELELAFNRNYTEGYFNGNANIISSVQNHIGIRIGKVLKIEKGKKFNQVYFTSKRNVPPKSILKFFGEKEQIVVSAFDIKTSGENEYVLTTTNQVSKGDFVNLIVDSKKEKEVLSAIKKRPIKINIIAKIGQPICAEFTLNNQSFSVYGQVLEHANSRPLTENELQENFEKNEFFKPKINIICLESVFILKQKLNEFRRKVFSEIINELTQIDKCVDVQKIPKLPIQERLENFCIIEDLSQEFFAKNIIYSPEEYDEKEILSFKSKCEKLGKIAYLDTPNFALHKDIELLKNIINNTGIKIVANNYYALTLTDDFVVGAGLNIYNNFSAFELGKRFFTAESDIATRINFPFMTLRHCPMKNLLDSTCERCQYQGGYEYKMDSGKILKLKRKKLSDCTFYLTE